MKLHFTLTFASLNCRWHAVSCSLCLSAVVSTSSEAAGSRLSLAITSSLERLPLITSSRPRTEISALLQSYHSCSSQFYYPGHSAHQSPWKLSIEESPGLFDGSRQRSWSALCLSSLVLPPGSLYCWSLFNYLKLFQLFSSERIKWKFLLIEGQIIWCSLFIQSKIKQIIGQQIITHDSINKYQNARPRNF